jgi:hypothetical protein
MYWQFAGLNKTFGYFWPFKLHATGQTVHFDISFCHNNVRVVSMTVRFSMGNRQQARVNGQGSMPARTERYLSE